MNKIKVFFKKFVLNFIIVSVLAVFCVSLICGVYFILPKHISQYSSTEAFLRIGGIVLYMTFMVAILVTIGQNAIDTIYNKLKKLLRIHE